MRATDTLRWNADEFGSPAPLVGRYRALRDVAIPLRALAQPVGDEKGGG